MNKLLLLLLLIPTISCSDQSLKEDICKTTTNNIIINSKHIKAENACTTEEMQLGLMHRNSLGENEGMLFIFDYSQQLNFWMKNTNIPLDIAFIDENLIITQIEHLKPHDETPIISKQKNLIALEVNSKFFATNKIEVGMKININ